MINEYCVTGSVGIKSEKQDQYSKIKIEPIRGRVLDLEGKRNVYQDSDAIAITSMKQDE